MPLLEAAAVVAAAAAAAVDASWWPHGMFGVDEPIGCDKRETVGRMVSTGAASGGIETSDISEISALSQLLSLV